MMDRQVPSGAMPSFCGCLRAQQTSRQCSKGRIRRRYAKSFTPIACYGVLSRADYGVPA